MRIACAPKRGWVLVAYVVLDIICVGMGMGVPIVNILFGLVVGFYLARTALAEGRNTRQVLQRLLRYATLTAAVTFLGMVLIWARMIPLLWDPAANLANTGIPLILYEPRASLIGWLVLMILISPFLQLLTTLFAAHVTWLYILRRQAPGEDA